MQSLSNKCVLITGAAGGIGSVLAGRLLRKEGARLILVDKDFQGLGELKVELEQSSTEGSVQIYEADLAAKTSIERLFEQIEGEEIDVLVNNAGIAYGGTFAEMDLEDFEEVIDVNLYAAVRLTHLLLPGLIQRRGSIVNVGSAAGLLGPAGMNAYATSKFGLAGFSESLRAELKGKVGVSIVCPCFVKTPIAKNTLLPSDLDPSQREKQRERIDRLVQGTGMTSERVCKVIIKSIKRNKGLVVVGFNARVLQGVKKCSPRLADFLNHVVFRILTRWGCVR